MSARDEREYLAELLEEEQESGRWAESPDADLYGFMADKVLAAGYTKPRTITTAEELDALPAKSVILDANSTPWVCDGDMAEPWASVCEDPFGGPIWKDGRDILLPATVIHAP